MTPIAILILALSMSADAFAAAICKGAGLFRPRLAEALRVGLIFGAVETVTPVIGWGIGSVAALYIAAVDHWVAFGLLLLVGGKMIWESLHHSEERAPRQRYSLLVLVVTAIGTSLDAMAVGVTLAVLEVDILLPALAIGLATFVMATMGMMIGRAVGERYGRAAEAFGGLVLIAIGTAILIEHTMGG